MALQGIEAEGVIIAAMPEKSGVSKSNGNEWKSGEFVIETTDQYPRKCLFRVFGADKLQQFGLQVGERVKVFLDINARAWQDKFFNEISCYRVERVNQQNPQQMQYQQPQQQPIPQQQPAADNSMPF